MVLDWWTLLQTLLSNSVCSSHFTLHTSHCTLLASLLPNPVCSSNRRHFSYATLPFTILTEVLPERGTRMRLLTDEKDLWEKVQQSWEFSKGGWVPPFAVHTFQKQDSSSLPLLKLSCFLQQAPATSQAPSQMPWGGKVFFLQKNVLFTGLSGSGWVKSMALKVWSKEILKREIL